MKKELERKQACADLEKSTTNDMFTAHKEDSLLEQKKYSIPEAAKLMRLGETNLRSLINEGQLPVLRLTNTKILLLKKDIESFLKNKYGYTQKAKINQYKLPYLPDTIKNSKYLTKKAG